MLLNDPWYSPIITLFFCRLSQYVPYLLRLYIHPLIEVKTGCCHVSSLILFKNRITKPRLDSILSEYCLFFLIVFCRHYRCWLQKALAVCLNANMQIFFFFFQYTVAACLCTERTILYWHHFCFCFQILCKGFPINTSCKNISWLIWFNGKNIWLLCCERI